MVDGDGNPCPQLGQGLHPFECSLEISVIEVSVDIGSRLNRGMSGQLLGEIEVALRAEELRDRRVASRLMHRRIGGDATLDDARVL